MAANVIMPKQGLQMTEGTITKWLVPEGGDCVAGEPLFEIETDKLTITIDANYSGKLLKKLFQEGDTAPVTQIIAIIGEEGENIDDIVSAVTPEKEAEREADITNAKPFDIAVPATSIDKNKVFISPRAKMRAAKLGYDISQIAPTGPDGMIVEKDVIAFSPVQATPLARKIAAGADIDINTLAGTGVHGKVIKDDVLALLDANGRQRNRGLSRGVKVTPMTGMRSIIAARMRESLHTNASLTHQIKVDMTAAGELRNSFQAAGQKISYNDLIIMATTRALVDYPVMNSQITDEGIATIEYVNIGIAVALEEGLIVPNIKDADLMGLKELAAAARGLADKAKNNALAPEDCADGTFTISNLGMFGLDSFTAIINPPESGILAVGAIEETAVVRDQQVVIRPMMVMTLTYDHRIVDGMPAARFISRIKQYLETPCLML